MKAGAQDKMVFMWYFKLQDLEKKVIALSLLVKITLITQNMFKVI